MHTVFERRYPPPLRNLPLKSPMILYWGALQIRGRLEDLLLMSHKGRDTQQVSPSKAEVERGMEERDQHQWNS